MTTPPPRPLATPVPWDLVADGYVAENLVFFESFARRALELAKLPERARVVDVAAGPGTLSLLAAARVEHVCAIDFSPAMLEHLRKRASAAGIGNVEARVGDGQALPLEDASFDGAFSMFGLIFFPDRARGFAELHRVLRPGGRAVVASWLPVEEVPFMSGVFEALRANLPNLPTGEKTALGTEAECRQEMEAAGFTGVEVHPASGYVEAESTAAMWASLEKGFAPAAMMKKALGDTAWSALSAGIGRALEERFGKGPQRGELRAWLTVGTRRP